MTLTKPIIPPLTSDKPASPSFANSPGATNAADNSDLDDGSEEGGFDTIDVVLSRLNVEYIEPVGLQTKKFDAKQQRLRDWCTEKFGKEGRAWKRTRSVTTWRFRGPHATENAQAFTEAWNSR